MQKAIRKPIFIILFIFIFSAAAFLFILTGNKSSAPASSENSLISSEASESQDISSGNSAASSAVVSAASSQTSSENTATEFNANKTGLPVLTFHHFLRDENKVGNKSTIIQSESEFDSQMKALYDNGYKTLTLNEAMKFLKGEAEIPKKSVLLTFDDGYKSNIYVAAPVLRKYGFNGVVFVITWCYDNPDEDYNPDSTAFQYVNKSDMEKGSDVFEYACHANKKHVDFTKTEQSVYESDMKACREILGGCEAMAYPIGKYNVQVKSVMKSIGFKYCFTTEREYAKQGVDLFAIPRFTIVSGTTVQTFLKVVETGKTA